MRGLRVRSTAFTCNIAFKMLRRKTYTTEGAYRSHIVSKKHKENESIFREKAASTSKHPSHPTTDAAKLWRDADFNPSDASTSHCSPDFDLPFVLRDFDMDLGGGIAGETVIEKARSNQMQSLLEVLCRNSDIIGSPQIGTEEMLEDVEDDEDEGGREGRAASEREQVHGRLCAQRV